MGQIIVSMMLPITVTSRVLEDDAVNAGVCRGDETTRYVNFLLEQET